MVGLSVPVHTTHHFLVQEWQWQVNGSMSAGGHKYQNIIVSTLCSFTLINILNNNKSQPHPQPPSYTDSAVSKTTVTKTLETMETVVMGVFSSVFSLLLRKEAACVLRACDIHNRIACQDKYYEPCRAGTVVVLIMINVGNNHLWNKSQLELNNAWGISFIEKQSDKSARHSSPRSQPVGELPRQELCMKMK